MRTIVIIVVVLLVVIAVGVWAVQRQRTTRLRDRFGEEYDRTLDRTGSRREAEQTLAQVAERRDALTIRPLSAEQRTTWRRQWATLQARFVDAPAEAVGTARDLLPALMAERGYPTDDFEERAALLSADHPVVVEEYRAAEAAYQRHRSAGGSSTEALRQALVHYRALFVTLTDDGSGTELPGDLPGSELPGTDVPADDVRDRADVVNGTALDPGDGLTAHGRHAASGDLADPVDHVDGVERVDRVDHVDHVDQVEPDLRTDPPARPDQPVRPDQQGAHR